MSLNSIVRKLMLVALACAPLGAWSKFVVNPAFRNSSQPGWSLTGSAQLTAAVPPGYDPEGDGWLRLTENAVVQTGVTSYTGGSFSATEGVVIDFDYVMWMRNPAQNSAGDGLSFYLYDASKSMSGASSGGGLGYCGGDGGYLGIGFDSFGNFTPSSGCELSGGAQSPNSIVVRGPLSTRNIYVAGVSVPALNEPTATARPAYRSARIILTPTGDNASPFLVSVEDGPAGALVPVITDQPFPFAAPDQLSIGFAASTGGATEVHEVRMNKAAATADVQIDNTMTSPASRRIGDLVSYSLKVKNNVFPNSILSAEIDDPASAPLVNDSIAELTDKTWTCTASGPGTTCPAASGSGDFSNLGNYTMGQGGELSFVFQGLLDSSATCDASIATTATVNFANTAGFTDQDLSNNRASSAAFVVDCSPLPPITVPKPKPIPSLGIWGLGLLSLGLLVWAVFIQRRTRQG
ncbi:hypothetical protein M2375_000257 [Comamonas sp. BIGb0152]|uniref:lectin-like domain-containing protein n=1 Tax=Comamonas sp. BIGb0152 TaxID=2940601 RepID=UPI002168CBEB|nr:hypothetical protein [Comamonas sp. BIGb0152]MCS4292062.1 hypothetical protein [Comamonas sp. BIGb0152]